jgi:hypothetical protein
MHITSTDALLYTALCAMHLEFTQKHRDKRSWRGPAHNAKQNFCKGPLNPKQITVMYIVKINNAWHAPT